MPYALLSAAVTLACVVASVRRFVTAVAPTALHPALLAAALEGKGQRLADGLRRALATGDALAWERDLFAAFDETDLRVREALVNEQLMDLDARTRAGSRVPRVCASVATSAGFLFGLLALLHGLETGADGADDVQASLHGALGTALAALAIGIAGASFCAAVHVRAAKVVRERLGAIDRLVDRLGRLRPPAGSADASDAPDGAGERELT